MNALYNLKIGPKLLVTIAVSCAALLVVLGTALWGAGRYAQAVTEMSRVSAVTYNAAKLRAATYRKIIVTRGYLISGVKDGLDAELAGADARADQAIAELRASTQDATQRGRLEAVVAAYGAIDERLVQKRALKQQGDMAAIVEIERHVMPGLLQRHDQPLSALFDDARASAVRTDADVQALGRGLVAALVGLGLAGIGVSVTLSLLVARSITGPLKRAISVTEQVARGELPAHVERSYDDCVGDLVDAVRTMVTYLQEVSGVADAMSRGDLSRSVTPKSERDVFGTAIARMVEGLRRVVGSVRANATAVAEASNQTGAAVAGTSASMTQMVASVEQVAANAQNLSANVEETSASIEQMAASIQQVAGSAEALSSAVSQTGASIQQMTVTIAQVAGSVAAANDVADRAAEVATGGREAVGKTVDGMARINAVMTQVVGAIEGLGQSSEQIGDIVELIEDIAEQTNLLALNAAIEAARAGEHGRGFAVVADEVRKLAERSAKATKEIAELIKSVQHETGQAIASTRQGEHAIQAGTALAQQAGASLEQIVAAVAEVSDLMRQINDATQEQSAASEQITRAADHMTHITAQVSGATAEQARASEQIMKAVDLMNRMTAQVSGATAEQKRSSEHVGGALQAINRQADDLQGQAAALLEAIAFFDEGATIERTVPAPRREPVAGRA